MDFIFSVAFSTVKMVIFPNQKATTPYESNQKYDALNHYVQKNDGQLCRSPTAKESTKGKGNRRVVCNNEIFLRICKVHLQLWHAGINKVAATINERFYRIRKTEVEWLL